MEFYLVGGAVRDELLQIPSQDEDYLVVGASPQEMLAAGFIPVGKDFPVFLHPQTKQEYALARTERKVGKGYKGFVFYTDKKISLKEDLLRRDFTINALAKDKQGKILDFNNGIEDLNNRVLRHISPAFREDPLRVLRLARFYAKLFYLGFKPDKSTLEVAKQIIADDEIQALSKERIWQETLKALQTKNPSKYFELLFELNCLSIIMPKLTSFYQNSNGAYGAFLAFKQLDSLVARFSPEVSFSHLLSPLSLEDIKSTAKDLNLPNNFLAYGKLAHFILRFNKTQDFSSEAIMQMCNKTDFWRKPKEVLQVLQSFDLAKIGALITKIQNLDLSSITQSKLIVGVQIKQAIYDFRKSQLDLLLQQTNF